ncbi:LacI family DNA-binding transcriptional regulator [Sphingomonas profundi]|uniref:LacI family DNA-binding transcriptional regulator n=1 Tax=Alterirhizorhabdus profundi TaxID=2681549 RepID=UPI0018D0F545|nr:LacI family DNA-binding transcriptional regulator [Sphingomonas profundi]
MASDDAGRAGGARLTMADLSRIAGVSKITVSRALRDSDLVRPELRARIRELAESKGYRLNVAARDLRLQRRRRVAVIVEMQPSEERPMSDPYPLALLGGIVQECSSAGYGVLLTTAEPKMRAEVEDASGIILLGQGSHDDAVRRLAGHRVPLVIWGADDGFDGQAIVVGSDNRHGGQQAAGHLLRAGRRRLAFVGDTSHAELADRHAGFGETAAAGGAAIVATCAAGFTVASARAAVADLIAGGPAIDGLFAASDLMAIGAVEAIRAAGLTVPGDISVIGYDDSPAAAAHAPPLSTIRQDWVAGGRLLATKLIACLSGAPAASEMLETELVARGT